MGIISAIQMIGIPVVVVFPAIIKKFSTARLMFVGCLLSAFGYFLNFFAGGNIVLLGIAAVCYGVGSVPISMLINLLIIECANFNEWKGMQRMEGTLGCVTGFATKVGSAVGAGVLGVLLSLSLLLYKLDKLMPRIKEDNEARRQSIAEKTEGQQKG